MHELSYVQATLQYGNHLQNYYLRVCTFNVALATEVCRHSCSNSIAIMLKVPA